MATVIGLTGGIASGKSTVSNMLKKRGFTIVDADLAARAVVEPGEKAYEQVVVSFGRDILHSDGSIDRAKLGSIIFHDENERKKLNQIVHPAVRIRMEEWKKEAIVAGKQTIIYDIPLLFESKLTHLVKKTILVFVNEETQLQRLMKRNNLTESEAMARIQSQLSLKEKINLADYVIDNNGSLTQTEFQIDDLIINWKLKP
ncbi:dephospho-CoA kinase [Bacillus niameyensis]|uniref:dephospho-CoA kinase n=1 Tax=Bacillus niameyensis TaxID=1522308 RepID=UPI000785C5F1|nr:dephospho-CoA kinase [Bacillus niameyensis]